MPVIANTARSTKRWKLLVGTDEYQGHTSKIDITPKISSWEGGDGNTITDDAGCDVAMSIAQDTENEESLWRIMRDRAGEKATLVVSPHHDGTFSESVDITLQRLPMTMARGTSIPEVNVTLAGVYTPAVTP
ncbi:hypothetical protein [Microbacterium maritypicum]|uniref:Uncharacterized protein n=1 Tax=Microbacterium maritypicum MF109 TaxID=1333857 RepID=T5KIU1_MICMQ|nr:hypothetical protein [Microbacterium liquefaciens]EQM75922.1 hypothetical protein L687_18600 [Microbacterium maritypicum MF109]